MKSLYLFIDFFTILVPFLFSFHPRLNFHIHFKEFFISALVCAIPFLIWDAWFTSIGVWGFNPDYVSGIYLFKLPLEEILFFFCIPFSCLFTIHCFKILVTITWSERTEALVILAGSTLLIGTGLFFHNKIYTSISFISTGILLLVLKYLFSVTWFVKLIPIYIVLLIPFFIVNGILTGTGLEEPVVWYNNDENLGIRVLTIPVEDFIYGFELILLNMSVFEYLKERSAPAFRKK